MEKIRIGLELRSLNNLIRRYFAFSGHKKEIETITGNNGWIIAFLAENADKDIYQKDIEDFFTVTRSTMSRVLSLMEQKDLIERQTVVQDARLKKIVLTDKAWKIKKIMSEDAKNMERVLVQGFSDEEIVTLNGYLQKMKNNISYSQQNILKEDCL